MEFFSTGPIAFQLIRHAFIVNQSLFPQRQFQQHDVVHDDECVGRRGHHDSHGDDHHVIDVLPLPLFRPDDDVHHAAGGPGLSLQLRGCHVHGGGGRGQHALNVELDRVSSAEGEAGG